MPRKIESKNLIVKSNHLIEANYRLSAGEQKVLYKLINSIEKDDTDFKLYKFKVSDFLELLEVNNPRKYKEVQKITYSLLAKRLSIYDETLSKLTQVTWLAQAEYYSKTGMVDITFAPALKPYLLQLKGNFTRIDITNLMQLKSGYSHRIYTLLKRHEFENKIIEYKIEDLRNMLGIEKNEYKLYSNFKNKVILQAQREINKVTDLFFDFKEIKDSRKVCSIKFIIKPNEKEQDDIILNKVSDNNELNDSESNKILNLEFVKEIKNQFKTIYKGNLMDKFINKMIESKGIKHIQECLKDYQEYIQGRNIENIAGDFYTFVMKGYEKPICYKGNIPQYADFDQRDYNEEDLKKFYANLQDD